MTVKTKIYLAMVLWIGASLVMYFYGFRVLEKANRSALTKISVEKGDLLQLKAEQESYLLAQKDLQDLSARPYQPENFFSVDVNLVKEIQAVEQLGEKLGLNLALGGISGTINTVPKAKTQGELFLVPYTIGVSGGFDQVVQFIEILENLEFITNLNSLTFTGGADGSVTASMSANFYIRR